MNNIFTNKKIYEMLGKSKGPGKLTDLSGDGKVTQKDVLIGRGVLPEPPKSGGPAKTRAEMRLEKTKMKAQKAKDATKGKKSSESKEVIRQANKAKRLDNKAKRLDKKAKRQEGRAERKKIRKADLSRGDKRKQIIDSRTKQKAKNTVVKKPKTEITKKPNELLTVRQIAAAKAKEESKKTINTKFKGGKIGDKDGDGKIDVNLVKDSKKSEATRKKQNSKDPVVQKEKPQNKTRSGLYGM